MAWRCQIFNSVWKRNVREVVLTALLVYSFNIYAPVVAKLAVRLWGPHFHKLCCAVCCVLLT